MAQTPYPILLAETGMISLEGEAVCQCMAYLNKVGKMDASRLPHKALETSQTTRWYQDGMKLWGMTAADIPEESGCM